MLQPSVKLRLSLHGGGKGARQQFEGPPPHTLRARSGSTANYKQGPRKAASLTLLTLRAREACAELTEESERAGVPPAQPVALLACPGLLPRPAGWFFFPPPFTTLSLPLPGKRQNWLCSRKWKRQAWHGTARHNVAAVAAVGELPWGSDTLKLKTLSKSLRAAHPLSRRKPGCLCVSPADKQL